MDDWGGGKEAKIQKSKDHWVGREGGTGQPGVRVLNF